MLGCTHMRTMFTIVYNLYLMLQMKPVAAVSGSNFPKGLANYVDRGTLEICLHLIVLSLSVVFCLLFCNLLFLNFAISLLLTWWKTR